MGELAQADCVIADLTSQNRNTHFELGLAVAMGKPVFLIVRADAVDQIPFYFREFRIKTYTNAPKSLDRFSEQLTAVLSDFRHSPRKSQFISGSRISTPFFVDWEKLSRTESENLCRELLSQMGFTRVNWYKESKEIDLIAEYPRKDPDGFEYRELWLVAMGRNSSIDNLLRTIAGNEPEEFLRHLLRGDARFERMWSRDGTITVTLLLIALEGGPHLKDVEMLGNRITARSQMRGISLGLRLRLWDRDYLTGLVHQFPNIGYKYFSDEARLVSTTRKGYEELYQ
ncbi:MAG: zraS 1, partial [Planctomycetaceae bacterium]|nr:zraS 1 [Planctomycetaceae bacterium]